MGLLTQLIADHHDTVTRQKAQEVGMWKGILEDQRSPEDGGFTVDMKNHALEQMVGMANGGGKGKGGGGGGVGAGGGGGSKGKAGEMLGVFRHLLGLNGGGNKGAGGGAGSGNMQGAAAGSTSGVLSPDEKSMPNNGPVQSSSDLPQGQPETAQPVQPAQAAPAQARKPLQRLPLPLPKAFMTDAEREARKGELYGQETQRQVGRGNALGEAQGALNRSQEQIATDAKIKGVEELTKKFMATDPQMTKQDATAQAEAFYGVKAPAIAHKVGAASFEMRNGKNVKVTSMSDGTEMVEPDITKQPTGSASAGLTGNAKNLKWAHDHESSTDPTEQITAKQILNEHDNSTLTKDMQFKVKSLQYSNLKNATDPASVASIADGVKKGLLDPNMTNMSRATATLVSKQLADDGFNQAAAKQEYNAVKSNFAALNSPQQIRIRQNVEQAKESLPLIKETGQAWADAMKSSGKNPLINSAELMLAKQGVYGEKAQTAAVVFEGQLTDVVAELSSIYMQSSSPTDKAIELAQKSLQSNWNWTTLQAQLSQVDKNLDRRASAISHLVVMGAGTDSTYIPRGTDGQVQTTDQNKPAPDTGDWKNKPDAQGVITRPDGQKFKKVNGGFLPVAKGK